MTLIPIIKRYVRQGSVIYSESWRTLDTLGYTHYQVNHSEHFVGPRDPTIHILNIG